MACRQIRREVSLDLARRTVHKQGLLDHRFVNLQSDALFGETKTAISDHEEIPLGELCEILDSKRRPITKSDRKRGEIPYYGATGIVDYVEGYIFDEPLVLVGEDGAKWGPNERSAFAIVGKTWVNNHAHVLRPKRSCILDTYLVAILNRLDLMPYVTGVTVPKLNLTNREIFLFPPPPPHQHQKILPRRGSHERRSRDQDAFPPHPPRPTHPSPPSGGLLIISKQPTPVSWSCRPEAQARITINKMLEDAGWRFLP